MKFDLELKRKKTLPKPPENGGASLGGKFLIGALFVIAVSYISYVPPARSINETGLKIGDIADSDIVIGKDMTIEDKEMTDAGRRRALAALTPVYEFNEQKAAGSQMLLNEWFSFIKEVRRDFLLKKRDSEGIRLKIQEDFGIELPPPAVKAIIQTNAFAKIDQNKLLLAIKSWEEKGVLLSRIGAPKGNADKITVYNERKGYAQARLTDFYDFGDIAAELTAFLEDYRLNAAEKEVVQQVLLEFVSVNVTFSKALTRLQEEKTLAAVNPAFIRLKKGKIVLRRGDEISKDHMRLIGLIAAEEKTGSRPIPGVIFILAVLAVLFFFFWKLNFLTGTGGINRSRLNLVSGVTFITSVLIYRLALFIYPLILRNVTLDLAAAAAGLVYAVPFAVGSLIISFLFDLRSAVFFSFMNSVIGAFICDWDFKVLLFILAGNLAVAFGVEFYQRLKRSSILKAAFFWLLPVNVIMAMMLALTENESGWAKAAFYVAMGIFAALLSAFIANFMIPLWEVSFKLVTDLKLIEITNLNLPCFREMLEKAPGTYHHSQMVASLAEAAAQDLQLSPLLLRAMALYHDIGKIDNPQFFTENQSVYEDPHGQLTPLESAKVIISHIDLGLEKAERLKLPSQVTQAISQHHGTKVVKYFHAKAKELGAGQLDEFDENMYRYPGRKPQQMEAAIIMLADQVEAATKSLSAPDDKDIRNVVEKIIASDIAENQFDECDGLTFKALNTIAASFYGKLTSIYHQRVSYPGFDFSKGKTDDNHPA